MIKLRKPNIRPLTFLLLLCSLCVILTPLEGQIYFKDNPVRVLSINFDRDTFLEPSSTEYQLEYNESGKVISYQYYRDALNNPYLYQEESYRYSDGQISFSDFFTYARDGDVLRYLETTYEYHDSCLLQKIEEGVSFGLPLQNEYRYDSLTCQIVLQEDRSDYNESGIYTPHERYEWTYNDSMSIKSRYQYLALAEIFKLRHYERTYFDEENRIKAEVYEEIDNNYPRIDSTYYHYNNNFDPSIFSLRENFRFNVDQYFLASKTELEVNEDSAHLHREEYDINGGIVSFNTNTWKFFYDENDNLEKQEYRSILYYRNSGDTSYLSYNTYYTYDCKNRLTERIREASFDYVYITRYFYEDPCEDESEVTNESINIYPNPAIEYIFIESELIKDPATQIELIAVNGSIMPMYNRGLGLDKVRLPIDHLPMGVYAIRIISKDKQATELFIKN